MDEKDIRQMVYPCPMGAETGPQTIIVRQVIAEKEAQLVLDIHVVVPDPKPAIEQIVDVFVKKLEINCVDVITDKIIVRGEFEIKAVYVACLPDQPVHAVEIKHYRWTRDIVMPGARRGMDGDSSVVVEFVDYDVDECSRAYKYKYEDMTEDCDDDDVDDEEDCEEDDHDDHDDCDCEEDHNCNGPKKHHHNHHHHNKCTREFDVSVVLKFIGKVMTNREIQIGGTMGATGTTPGMPAKPKG